MGSAISRKFLDNHHHHKKALKCFFTSGAEGRGQDYTVLPPGTFQRIMQTQSVLFRKLPNLMVFSALTSLTAFDSQWNLEPLFFLWCCSFTVFFLLQEHSSFVSLAGGCLSLFFHLLAVQPLKTYLIILNLDIIIHKIKVMIPTS